MSILHAAGSSREVINGRYELVNPVGHGGMGTVYRAVQRPIDREVAVKILRRADLGEDGPRAVKRFFKEAKAIASLHHPNIISLYDFGQDETTGDLFLVMELLPGKPLGDIIHRHAPMPIGHAARLLDPVLDALQEAHRSEIVHRDLKPDNIQVGRRGDVNDFVTVLDFGIARRQNLDGKARDSTTIEVCGTPAYMSPEQILGTAVDPRSDLYAVGVLLYEMITGQLPFDSERTIDVYLGHLKQEVPRLRDVMPSAARIPGLQELLDRALAKSAEDRITDAGSFRRALRSIAGLPTSSTGPGILGTATPIGVAVGSGFELVATVEPGRAPGVDDLVQQWTVDIGQLGGVLREKSAGRIIASFPGVADPVTAIRAALSMKKRTRAQRLSTLRPLYLRVGIHEQPSVAMRLCEEAPRGGLVIAAECVSAEMARSLGSRFRLEPAGELRIRGHRGTLKMLQVLAGR